MAVITSACSSTTDWGPLAVVVEHPDVRIEAPGGTGPLIISRDCVVLNGDMGQWTLIWRASDVRWDALTSTILFQRAGGPALEFEDGTQISIGGAGEPSGDWVQPPAPTCPERIFVVHDAVLEE